MSLDAQQNVRIVSASVTHIHSRPVGIDASVAWIVNTRAKFVKTSVNVVSICKMWRQFQTRRAAILFGRTIRSMVRHSYQWTLGKFTVWCKANSLKSVYTCIIILNVDCIEHKCRIIYRYIFVRKTGNRTITKGMDTISRSLYYFYLICFQHTNIVNKIPKTLIYDLYYWSLLFSWRLHFYILERLSWLVEFYFSYGDVIIAG